MDDQQDWPKPKKYPKFKPTNEGVYLVLTGDNGKAGKQWKVRLFSYGKFILDPSDGEPICWMNMPPMPNMKRRNQEHDERKEDVN